VHPIAAVAASAGTSHAGPAVAVVLAVIGIWRLAVGGRGEIKLRLLAWLLLPLIVWGLVAANSPAEAGRIAAGTASGVSVVIMTVSKVISAA
jgi:hypothetical protein